MGVIHLYGTAAVDVVRTRGMVVISLGEGTGTDAGQRTGEQHVAGGLPDRGTSTQDIIERLELDVPDLAKTIHAFLHRRREADGHQHNRTRQQHGWDLETPARQLEIKTHSNDRQHHQHHAHTAERGDETGGGEKEEGWECTLAHHHPERDRQEQSDQRRLAQRILEWTQDPQVCCARYAEQVGSEDVLDQAIYNPEREYEQYPFCQPHALGVTAQHTHQCQACEVIRHQCHGNIE